MMSENRTLTAMSSGRVPAASSLALTPPMAFEDNRRSAAIDDEQLRIDGTEQVRNIVGDRVVEVPPSHMSMSEVTLGQSSSVAYDQPSHVIETFIEEVPGPSQLGVQEAATWSDSRERDGNAGPPETVAPEPTNDKPLLSRNAGSSSTPDHISSAYHSTLTALEAVHLPRLMEISVGRPDVMVALLDGPVATDHPLLDASKIQDIDGGTHGDCGSSNEVACAHGTFVAGMLVGVQRFNAPAICPRCTLLTRPIFSDNYEQGEPALGSTPEKLVHAIVDCISAGARVLNLSVELVHLSARGMGALQAALDLAMRNGVLIVAAAGNQAMVGGATLAWHPWVIPVVACDRAGRPLEDTNLGASIGRQGVCAVGDAIKSLGPDGGHFTMSGTSAAAPFVTGTIALLWSIHPTATAADIRISITRGSTGRQKTIVPPKLNAWAAHQYLVARA